MTRRETDLDPEKKRKVGSNATMAASDTEGHVNHFKTP